MQTTNLDTAVALAMMGDNSKSLTLAERLAIDSAELKTALDALVEEAKAAPKEVKTREDLEKVGAIILKVKDLSKRAEAARAVAKEPFLAGGRDVDTFFKETFGQADKKPYAGRLGRAYELYQGMADVYAEREAARQRAVKDAEAKKARDEEQARIDAAAKAAESGRLKTAANHAAEAEIAGANAEKAEAAAQAPVGEMLRRESDTGMVSSAKETLELKRITDVSKIDLNVLKPYFPLAVIETAIKMGIRLGVIRDLPGAEIGPVVKATFRK